jgi:rare lipoprotein A
MNRVLSILVATLLAVANVWAATVPNHPQQPVKKPAPRLVKTAPKVATKPYQVGNASWYGKQFHGRATASGEDFDMFELTAAHRRLPLGTFVKVTNLRNGKWIVVRVNDRGPYVSNRIMDLSYSAARMLSFRDGIERVRLDLIQPKNVASSQASSSR